jgi:hypothetical protein
MKEGPYAGTPEDKWTPVFINEVLGMNLTFTRESIAWFKNPKTHEELVEGLRENLIRVIAEVMNRDDLPPASRLKAVELAMKTIAAYDEKDKGADKKGSEFSPEEEEALRAAGQGAFLDIMKTKR